MCRVAVSMFRLNRFFHSFINIVNRYNWQNWHHQFCLHKRMVCCSFINDTTDIFANLNANRRKYLARVTSNPVFVDDQLSFIILNQNSIYKLFSLCIVNLKSSVLQHIINQFIPYIAENKNFFFSNTRQIVVKGTAVNNILCRFWNICSIIDDDRRISCACTNRLFTG